MNPLENASTTVTGIPLLWSGKPSQLKNLMLYIVRSFLILLCFSVFLGTEAPFAYFWFIPIIFLSYTIIYEYLVVACTTYTVDAERITFNFGILARAKVSYELFRVHDVITYQSVWLRPFGLGQIQVLFFDEKQAFLNAVPEPFTLRDDINRAAIDARQAKQVQEINFGANL